MESTTPRRYDRSRNDTGIGHRGGTSIVDAEKILALTGQSSLEHLLFSLQSILSSTGFGRRTTLLWCAEQSLHEEEEEMQSSERT